MSCTFCDIAAGNSPASIFYEDEVALGFLSIEPINLGHVLVIPKRHTVSLSDLNEATGRHIWTIAQRTGNVLRRSGVRCEGINIFLADGAAAFQEVFHLHIHVFPRYAGDSFTLDADWTLKPRRSELDRIAEQMRSAYRNLHG